MKKSANSNRIISRFILVILAAMLGGLLLSAFAIPVPEGNSLLLDPSPGLGATEVPPSSSDVPVMEFEIPYEDFWLQDFYILDETQSWAVGNKGRAENTQPVIMLTSDGGENWVEVEPGFETGTLNSITFTDELVGYAAGQNWGGDIPTIILRTEDGGQTWAEATIPQVFGSVDEVYFSPAGIGWSVGFDFGNFHSLMLRSEDGITWVEQDHPTHEEAGLFGITFPTEEVGYAVGNYGFDNPIPYLIKTSDGGATWTEIDPPLEQAMLFDVLFLDEDVGVVVGFSEEQGIILVTEDGGESWTISEFSGSTVYLKKIFLYRAMLLVIGNICEDYGCKGLMLMSKDGGKVWQELLRLDSKINAIGSSKSTEDLVTVALYADSYANVTTTYWRYFSPDISDDD